MTVLETLQCAADAKFSKFARIRDKLRIRTYEPTEGKGHQLLAYSILRDS
jgi:hypothetical protein